MKTFAFLLSCLSAAAFAQPVTVTSPDGRVSCAFSLEAGHPVAAVSYGGRPAFTSELGVDRGELVVQKTSTRTVRGAWRPVWGFLREYPENYTELEVRLGRTGEVAARETLFLRCYDEGFAVRAKALLPVYGLGALAGARTSWRFADGAAAWGITSGEGTYPADPTAIGDLRADCAYMFPLTVRIPGVGFASVLEAHAERYPRSFLRAEGGVLRPRFVTGVKEGRGEFLTPWRAVMLAPDAAGLAERAYLVENLNPPCAIGDTSWIRPGFCVSDQGNFELRTPDVIAAAREAAAIGARYIQVDWGWYGTEYVWSDDDRAAYAAKHPELKDDATWAANTYADPRRVARGTVPYHPYWNYSGRQGVDLDIPKCVTELRALGLGLCLYVHGAILEAHDLDSLFATYEKWGVVGLKPGFVGYGSQNATDFLRRMAEIAARHHLWLDIHDSHLPDGMERTWPNVMITEGGGGEEGNHPVRQDLVLPFARCLAGPFDFTPCLFNAGKAGASKLHKLAMFLAYPGPTAVMRGSIIRLAKDDPDAAAFLRALPWNYDTTSVRDAEIGRHFAVVRGRKGSFFAAGLAGEAAHVTELQLDFLEPGVDYELNLLADDLSSAAVPRPYVRTRRTVRRGETVRIEMAACGGFCATLMPLERKGDRS